MNYIREFPTGMLGDWDYKRGVVAYNHANTVHTFALTPRVLAVVRAMRGEEDRWFGTFQAYMSHQNMRIEE